MKLKAMLMTAALGVAGAGFQTTASAAVPVAPATYNFDITIAGQSGSGTLTTASNASLSSSLITSLTGTFGGSAITLLAPGSFPVGAGSNDNLFSASSPYFDFNGLSFAAGGNDFNIFTSGSLQACSTVGEGVNCGLGASFSAHATSGAVPEPATWAMMLVGFGAAGYSMRRRQVGAVRFQTA